MSWSYNEHVYDIVKSAVKRPVPESIILEKMDQIGAWDPRGCLRIAIEEGVVERCEGGIDIPAR